VETESGKRKMPPNQGGEKPQGQKAKTLREGGGIIRGKICALEKHQGNDCRPSIVKKKMIKWHGE